MNTDKQLSAEEQRFTDIKFQVATIQFNYVCMSRDGKAIETNPSNHRITEYIVSLLEQKDKESKTWEDAYCKKCDEYHMLEIHANELKSEKDKWFDKYVGADNKVEMMGEEMKEKDKKIEDFTEWVDDSFVRNHKKGWANLWERKSDGQEFVTQQLHSLFIEQKNKKK